MYEIFVGMTTVLYAIVGFGLMAGLVYALLRKPTLKLYRKLDAYFYKVFRDYID